MRILLDSHTFEAVRRAIDEIAAIVGYIVNNLNVYHILVTADRLFNSRKNPPRKIRSK
jgi:hypothetical protein